MAKNILMQILTSLGYEQMYPFNPSLILNATVESTTTASNYNLTISSLTDVITNNIGNNMGIITFYCTITNTANATITLNGGTAGNIVLANGNQIGTGILNAGRQIYVKYYNGNYVLLLDKYQVGLSEVDNTSDLNKPISTAVQTALNNKLNIPTAITSNANLNTYQTAGLYYCATSTIATTVSNSPISVPFSLFVEQHMGVKQTFTAYTLTGTQTWVRNYYSGTWGAWQQQAFILFGTSDPSNSIGADGNIYLKIPSTLTFDNNSVTLNNINSSLGG